MAFRLIFLSPPSEGESTRFESASIVLGRGPDADLRIDETHVSGTHAHLFMQEGQRFIEDLNSTNGTFVNGRRVKTRTALKPGDTIQLGTTVKLRFEPETEDFGGRTVVAAPEEMPDFEPASQQPMPEQGISQPPYPQPQRKKKFPVWVVILLIGLVVVCLGVIFLGGGGLFLLNLFNAPERQTAAAGTQIAVETQSAAVQHTQLAITEAPQRTATAEAENIMAATAQAQTQSAVQTATAQAAWEEAQRTSTAQAEATAQAASQVWAFIQGNMIPEMLVYGPESGVIVQADDNGVDGFFTDVNLLNAVVTVDFYPPYSPDESEWDFGIFFRDLGSNDEYRVVIDSTGEYSINDRLGDENNYLSEGTITNLGLGPNEANNLVLLINGDRAVLFVNGVFVVEFDISRRMEAGEIIVATNIFEGYIIPGAELQYENLRIYELVQ
jgi:pSer/pThr/pTyr-binding forkhead associated (FHA) protein